MTRFLLATASVHTTAAACDYLADRITPDDEVVALSVVDGEVDSRDAGDALNVVSVRFPGADIETVQCEGEPGAEILGLASGRGVDEVVIGARRGDPDATDDADATADETDAAAGPGETPGRLGSTAGTVLASADRPVVVLPSANPDSAVGGA